MKMIVQEDLCTGCGACIEACQNEAISLKDGVAFIDQSRCSKCQVCIDTCPQGALSFSSSADPVTFEKINPVGAARLKTSNEASERKSNWQGLMLAYAGQYILPRLVDVLAAFIQQKLNSSIQEQPSPTIDPIKKTSFQHRRRHRRGISNQTNL